jgi:hypothetical protein
MSGCVGRMGVTRTRGAPLPNGTYGTHETNVTTHKSHLIAGPYVFALRGHAHTPIRRLVTAPPPDPVALLPSMAPRGGGWRPAKSRLTGTRRSRQW